MTFMTYLNYPILFEFLASTDKPVVWVSMIVGLLRGGVCIMIC